MSYIGDVNNYYVYNDDFLFNNSEPEMDFCGEVPIEVPFKDDYDREKMYRSQLGLESVFSAMKEDVDSSLEGGKIYDFVQPFTEDYNQESAESLSESNPFFLSSPFKVHSFTESNFFTKLTSDPMNEERRDNFFIYNDFEPKKPEIEIGCSEEPINASFKDDYDREQIYIENMHRSKLGVEDAFLAIDEEVLIERGEENIGLSIRGGENPKSLDEFTSPFEPSLSEERKDFSFDGNFMSTLVSEERCDIETESLPFLDMKQSSVSSSRKKRESTKNHRLKPYVEEIKERLEEIKTFDAKFLRGVPNWRQLNHLRVICSIKDILNYDDIRNFNISELGIADTYKFLDYICKKLKMLDILNVKATIHNCILNFNKKAKNVSELLNVERNADLVSLKSLRKERRQKQLKAIKEFEGFNLKETLLLKKNPAYRFRGYEYEHLQTIFYLKENIKIKNGRYLVNFKKAHEDLSKINPPIKVSLFSINAWINKFNPNARSEADLILLER